MRNFTAWWHALRQGGGWSDDDDFSGRKFNFPAVLSCASVLVVVVALPHSLFLARSLNELSEYLHKIKCCPTSWPAWGRRGGEKGGEAAQLSWQTCLKVAARLSRRRGTQRKKERVERSRERENRKGEKGKAKAGNRGVGGLHAPTHKGNGKAAHNKTQIRDEKQQKKKQMKMKQRRQVKKENMFILVAHPPTSPLSSCCFEIIIKLQISFLFIIKKEKKKKLARKKAAAAPRRRHSNTTGTQAQVGVGARGEERRRQAEGGACLPAC